MNEPDFNQLTIEIVPDGFWIFATNGDFPTAVPIWCRYDVGGSWQESTVTLPEAGGVPLLKLFWRPKQRLFVYTGSRPRRVVLNGSVDSASQTATQFLCETYAQRQARYSYWRDDSSFTVYPDYSDPIWLETNWPASPPPSDSGPAFAPPADTTPAAPFAGGGYVPEAKPEVPPTPAAGGFDSSGGIPIESAGRAADWASPGSSSALVEEPDVATREASSPAADPPLFPGVQTDAPPAEATAADTQQSTY